VVKTCRPSRWAFGCQSAPLVIGQPQASPADVLLESSVLFSQILDHRQLVTVHPVCQCDEQKLKREALNDRPSVCDAPLRFVLR
jgi:hypothetical protein